MDVILKTVKDEMASRGWGPFRLAKEAGINYNTLTRWMAGRGHIGLPALAKICTALKLTVRLEAESEDV